MTVGDIVFAVEAYMQQANVTVTLDRPTVLICLNEALQSLYPIELMADDSWWTASQTVSASGTVAYPSSYRTTRAVEITGAAIGGARKVGHREWQTVVNNSAIGPTNDDPIYRQDATGLLIAPDTAGAGVHYYLRTIPYVDDYAIDLFHTWAFNTWPGPPACMWAFQEALILLTSHLVVLRESQQANMSENEVARMFTIAERFKQEFDTAKRPLALYQQTTQQPMIPQGMLQKEST